MIGVSNRTTWEQMFSSDIITNCDLKVYDTSGNLLLNKEKIENFSLTSTNSFVCDAIPNDDCQINVLHWDTLSLAVQRFLTHKNMVRIKYVVNNVETTGYKSLLIKDTKVSRDNKKATIYLYSPINETSLYKGQICYCHSGTSGTIDRFFTSMAQETTNATAYQQVCLINCKGVKYTEDDTGDYPNIAFKNYTPNTPDGNFDGKNIYDDYEINKEATDKSNIKIYGAVLGETETFDIGGRMDSSIANMLLMTITAKAFVKEPYYVVDFTANKNSTSGESVRNKFNLHHYLKKATITRTGTRTNAFVYVTVQAKKSTLEEVEDNDNYYIQTYSLEAGSQALLDAENYCKSYFQNNRMLEFDCRIDPTLEPLDIIDVSVGTSGGNYFFIALESVTIEYNGGYHGHLIGRIINPITSLTVSGQQTSFTYGDDFVFGGTVIAHTTYGVDIDVTEECTISGYDMSGLGYQTVTVSYGNASTTYTIGVKPKTPTISNRSIGTSTMSFQVGGMMYIAGTYLVIVTSEGTWRRYYNGSETISTGNITALNDIIADDIIAYNNYQLQNPVICYLEYGSLVSDNAIVLPARYDTVQKPIISNLVLPSTDQQVPYGWSFRINNPNNFAVTVHVKDSSHEVIETISANSYNDYSNVDYYDFNASFNQYILDALEDDMYCWFSSGTTTSQSTIILEEQL